MIDPGMHGERFAEDPIGTYVDPAQLVAAWQTGLSAAELTGLHERGVI